MKRGVLVNAVIAVLAARLTSAQTGSSVSGVVWDSIARRPLLGAMVQIIPADTSTGFTRWATADSLGRFTIDSIPKGRFLIGFMHPLMDSLGLQPPLHQLRVDGLDPVRANFGVPSPPAIRTAICGLRSGPGSGGVIVGVVRDAESGAPMGGATVTVQWLELSLEQGSHIERVVATAAPNGWFALCNAPSPGTLTLRANSGADSTGLIDVPISSDGFARSDMYIGSARSTGTLRGTVTTADGGKPLAGAQVRVPSGPPVRTDKGGRWTLTGVPAGTQMLEITAGSYDTELRAVNVVAGALPVNAKLSTMKAVLDTAKSMTLRLSGTGDTAFTLRRRGGGGVYLTSDAIARARPSVTSDLFRIMPGVRLDSRNILVNGSAGWCSPAIYVDAMYIPRITSEQIDAFVQPGEIAAIEMFTSYTSPPQFRNPDGDCGIIAISTNVGHARHR